MRIAFLASEASPFAKTGGLADVIGTLPVALERLGHQVSLIMPAYRPALAGSHALEGASAAASLGGVAQEFSVHKATIGKNLPVHFVRADRYFDREFLYGTPAGDYPDNAERFVFFCRAALEIARHNPPDILHAHDWQTALAIFFLCAQPERYPELVQVKTVFTVHNLGFQGLFNGSLWPLLDCDRSWFNPKHLEFHGKINFLKSALVSSHKITTVSPTYGREIMTPEQGFGLDGVLRERAADVVGIMNGIDYDEWNPQNDPVIAARYDVNELAGKARCKQELQQLYGLPERAEVPLIGVVSRLTAQKGFDLVEAIWPKLMNWPVQFVLLGTGEARFVKFFGLAAKLYPDKVAIRIGFDEKLAHRIEAGADIFLMPSLYEPCGLNQMFSLRYGTIPIVRAVGGLNDSVANFDEKNLSGTGFSFLPYEADALYNTVERALHLFGDTRAWTALMRRAMKIDNSWDRSAALYSSLYQDLVR
ncbi:MAG: glycogen synthase GlgA [Deltaproteobacteria bacterium]|nr:glycogen synthase GlgA [Deltaproteobacteria bacterium]